MENCKQNNSNQIANNDVKQIKIKYSVERFYNFKPNLLFMEQNQRKVECVVSTAHAARSISQQSCTNPFNFDCSTVSISCKALLILHFSICSALVFGNHSKFGVM